MNKSLKIAIIGSRGYPYVYSGYETLVKELSERLVKKGHVVRVYCHKSLFKKRPRTVNGIELIYTPSIRSKVLSQLYNSFFSFMHVFFSDFDVVLVVNSANGPFGILTKLSGKKTCINVDGLEWLRPKWKGFGSLYFKISSKLATAFYDKIITDSKEMSMIYKKIFKKNSKIIAYGPTMKNTIKQDFLNYLNIKSNDYYLVVGRLIPDNNSKLIIEGFINSKSLKKIVIVGDVPYHDDYANEVKKMATDRVIFTGYVKSQEKLSQLYKNCYCYIHGHEFGGTNPTMINALYLKLKIIALDTIFNREMLENYKSIFFQKQVPSISKSIDQLEKTSKNINIEFSLPAKYKWENITEFYEAIFLDLVK